MIVLRALAASLLLPTLISLAAAQEQTAGNVTVSKAWARATAGGARNGAAFLEVSAKAAGGDRLVAAKSNAASRVELHTHIHEGGVMKMRRIDAIDVPAGQTVVLKPGGLHVMLLDLRQPLKAGEALKLTLVFEKAGEINIEAPIEPIGASGPAAAKDKDAPGKGKAPASQSGGAHKH